MSADNPASHMLGGYKNLSSAFRKCRHCLATEEDLQTVVNSGKFSSMFHNPFPDASVCIYTCVLVAHKHTRYIRINVIL